MGSGRMHIRGAYHLITNRTFQQRLLLLPSNMVNHLVGYWLARSLVKYGQGIQLYAAIFLSNHFHIMVRDDEGNLAKFIGYFKGNLACAINAHLGRKGAFWEKRYDDVILDDEKALHKKLTYVLSNAARSGLVNKSEEWPGFSTLRGSLTGEAFEFTDVNKTACHRGTQHRKNKRPKEDFIETYRFELAVLPMFEPFSQTQRSREIEQMMGEAEQFHRDQRGGKPPLGLKRILSQQPTDRPHGTKFPSLKERKRFDCESPKRLEELKALYAHFILQYKLTYDTYKSTLPPKKRFQNSWPPGSYPPSCRTPIVATD